MRFGKLDSDVLRQSLAYERSKSEDWEALDDIDRLIGKVVKRANEYSPNEYRFLGDAVGFWADEMREMRKNGDMPSETHAEFKRSIRRADDLVWKLRMCEYGRPISERHEFRKEVHLLVSEFEQSRPW